MFTSIMGCINGFFSFLGHCFRSWRKSVSDKTESDWIHLPPDILNLIVQNFTCQDDCFRIISVCKSWRDSLSQFGMPCLPPRYPLLLLAEEVAPGAILEDLDPEEEEEEEDIIEDKLYDHKKNSVGTSRGLYSFLTRKTYYIDLPEAAGKLIVGTDKGWLVTLGRDLKINLLHPLLNHQILLAPMLTFPRQMNYDEDNMPEEASDMFIQKVAMSSKILNKNTAFGLHNHSANPSPSFMAIYGDCGFLGFTRLGNNVWTDVDVPSRSFEDIVYHKGNFYAVDCHGRIFVCGINDNAEEGDIRGKEITLLKDSNDWDKKYLVELSSESGLLLLVRFYKNRGIKYRTAGFSVWRLDLKYSESFEDISCTLEEVNDLGNKAIFVGKASSTAVLSSEIIKPNCIYFTDDNRDRYYQSGGGHDMGIFNMEHHTIEPHFQGKSIHPISPPLWYI